MLLYGPPGTGKTTLMNMKMKVSGLTNLVNPIILYLIYCAALQ